MPFDPKPVPSGGLHAVAADRNRGPILDVLRGVLPGSGLVLEIASGTGQHAAFFASPPPAPPPVARRHHRRRSTRVRRPGGGREARTA